MLLTTSQNTDPMPETPQLIEAFLIQQRNAKGWTKKCIAVKPAKAFSFLCREAGGRIQELRVGNNQSNEVEKRNDTTETAQRDTAR